MLAVSVKETPEERDARLALERRVRELAELLEREVPRTTGVGFALFLFDFGAGGAISYISNAQRETMVRTVREWLARQERRS
jgi:hypothetical protein